MQNMDLRKYVKTEDALFHYTKTSIAIEQILNTRKFKLSIFNDTGDPQEYKFKIFNWFNLPENFDDLREEARTAINRTLQFQCRIMCFCSNEKPTLILSDGSSKQDDFFCSWGWEKSRMWSQYGDNHRGICLVLSKDVLKEYFVQRQTEIEKYNANYVKYFLSQKNYSPWPSVDSSSLENREVQECSLKYIKKYFEELFFRKHIDYRDEAEFRVVVLDPKQQLEYIDITTSLRGVIVGDRTPNVYFPLIKKMCKKLNIQCQQAYWSTSSPHMILRNCRSSS